MSDSADVYASVRSPRKACAIDGCLEVSTSRGWCSRHYQRWVRHGDPNASVRQRATVWEATRPDRGPAKYGMTQEQFDEMWDLQAGSCAICRKPLQRTGMSSCNIDHCHATDRVRGLLCRACNRGIGLLGDNAERLTAAASYLADESLTRRLE